MVKWDEYRVRRDAVIAMYIEARQKLAMKKVWALMATVYTMIENIWKKYRINYNITKLRSARALAASKIKGVFKLTMVRFFS